ncbi:MULTISPECIES: DUF2934 domain-containing protein [unclassified Sinorhizobium]|uniref:DUF2934 domain-containing protein n=1 Tax=unclassified Sinorhizobium TaxID=2613772 RepID=UPI003523C8D0
MAETREEWIRKRAYALWEEEGRPAGRDPIHWEQARKEREALEGSAASPDGKDVKSKAKRSPRKAPAPAANGKAETAKATTSKAPTSKAPAGKAATASKRVSARKAAE